ncbi:PAS modulated sigma54 specific transcriptional regulator, Fis family [Desulfovibrio sp. X2]|uniref:sigma-54 interaction domain-containing protein n=1 Tax=Desulfovibrio sp. X2 TaxID=941449 RepID=UPI000358B74E|nr:sigma 54-interacting transcriptional regulator [Desulfovibrio sp. X2]EPR43510.1 PAS modulated sigma54 specific transcriptional regulator, Fis family [Desulfovibrio sp. X2]
MRNALPSPAAPSAPSASSASSRSGGRPGARSGVRSGASGTPDETPPGPAGDGPGGSLRAGLSGGRVLDNLGVGVFSVDADWTIISFNPEAERITGFSAAEAMGRKCWEIFHTEYCNRNCHLQQAIQSGKTVARRQVHYLTRDNRRVPLEITASPLRGERRRIRGGVQCFTDRFGPAEDEARNAPDDVLRGVICRDPRMIELFTTARAVASTDASILFTGETGTGKDVMARSIHAMSPRRAGRFIKVNCAALPDRLLESELFGYKAGAFTDARKDKPGFFELAEGGTLFLDEIGEIPLELQAKLLQALEDRQFYPLGSSRPVSVNVRLLSATNADLTRRIAQGFFRADLFYRLRVLELHMPSLRERTADIVPLAEHFLAWAAEHYGKKTTHLDDSAKRLLVRHPFPGNVRELKHVIEQAVILSEGKTLAASVFQPILKRREPEKRLPAPPDESARTLVDRERDVILQALMENDWSIQRTAVSLNINRTTLWRRMRKYGI